MNDSPLSMRKMARLMRDLGFVSAVKPLRLVLEPRVVFDAAGGALVADVLGAADAPDAPAAEAVASSEHVELFQALENSGSISESHNIVFIDSSVGDPATLAGAVPSGSEIVFLSGDSDGLAQIAAYLEGRSGVGAIHIIGHGSEGQIALGTAVLDAASMQGEHLDELTAIGQALSADGDILIYGCDFTSGDAGLEAAMLLGGITGADVAASTDATGHADLGGDWDLETQIGGIETDILRVAAYDHVLSQNGTGSWSIVGTTATNATAGVTTTISFGTFSNGTTSIANVTNDTLNNIAVFSPTVQNTASLNADFNWDTSPETGTTEASVDAGTGIVTITFSQAITNPILHLDRIGGSDGTVQNGMQLTLLTGGITLTRLSGTSHFTVNSGVIGTSQIDQAIGGGYTNESSTTPNLGTASGSVQLNGTFTTVQFQMSAAPGSNEGGGADAIEFKLTFDPPPAAANDTFVVARDGAVTISPLANDTDVTFVPAPNYTGAIPNLTYTPNDGTVDGTPATVAFGPITPVNDAPVGVDDTIPVTEDTPVTQNVLPNDTDAEANPLTISSATIDTNGDGTPDPLTLGTPTPITDIGGNPIGTITVNPNGDVTFNPAPNYTGPVPALTYTPNDGTVDGAPATVTFGPITPVNDAPLIDLDSAIDPDVAEFSPVPVTFNAPAITSSGDPLGIGDVLVFANAATVEGVSIDFVATIIANTTGAAPSFTTPSGELNVGILANGGLTVRFQAVQSGTSTQVAGDFSFLEADLDGGVEQIIVAPADLDSYALNDNTEITVSSGVTFLGGSQGASYRPETSVQLNFANDSSFEVTFATVGTEPRAFLLSGSLPTVLTDPVVTNPNADTVVSFTEGGSPVNVADTDADLFDSSENDVVILNIVAGGIANVTAERVIVAGQTFDLSVDGSATSVTVGGTQIDIAYVAATGTFTITNATGATNPMPQADLDLLIRGVSYQNTSEAPTAGARTLAFTATDAGGLTSNTATATITVIPVNDAPAGVDDTVPVTEDTPATVNVLGNDIDVDGDPLTISSASIDTDGNGTPDPLVLGTPTNLTDSAGNPIGILTVSSNGNVTFVPAPNYTGPVPTLTYTPNDGTVDGTPATVTFGPITPVNDAPVVDLNSGPSGTAFSVTSVETDLIVGGGFGSTAQPAPQAPWVETQTGTSVASMFAPGGNGRWVSEVSTTTSNAAISQAVTVPAGSSATDQFGNVTQVATQLSRIELDFGWDNQDIGVGGANSNEVRFSYNGVVYAVFTSDGVGTGAGAGNVGTWTYFNGASGPSTTLSVADTRTNPLERIVINLPAGLTTSGPFRISISDSPTGPGVDDFAFDNIALIATTTTTVTAFAGDGVYDRASIFTEGDAPVNVADTDADLFDCSENDVVALKIVAGSIADGSAERVTIAGQTFDLSVDGNAIGVPVGGSQVDIAYVAATGTFTITNATGASNPMPEADLDTLIRGITYENSSQDPTAGDRTLAFTATDAGGLTSASAVATVTVTPANDAPVADDETGTTPEDTTLTVPAGSGLLVGDTDVDGDTLTITEFTVAGVAGTFAAGTTATIPSVGALTINSDGSYTFVPAANYNGTAPVATYTVSDGAGGTDTGTLALTVTPVSDAPVDGDEVVSLAEDASASGDLLANATDAEGDILSITDFSVAGETAPFTIGSPFTIAGVGTATINANGTYSFVPVAHYNGGEPPSMKVTVLLVSVFVVTGAVRNETKLPTIAVRDGVGDERRSS